VELQRQSQELHSKLAQETITSLDEELRRRAEALQDQEAMMRQQMLHSRGRLAMVQARVMDMIDKNANSQKGNIYLQISQDLDEHDEPEGEETAVKDTDADMWDMDWSKAISARGSPAVEAGGA